MWSRFELLCGSAHAINRRPTLWCGAVVLRYHLDQRRAVCLPAGRSGCDGEPDSLDGGERFRSRRCRGGRGDHFHRRHRTIADSRVLEHKEGIARWPRRGQRGGSGLSDHDLRGRHEQDREDRNANDRSDPATPHDEFGPACPTATRGVFFSDARPFKAGANGGEHDRQQRDRHQHADRRNQHARVADAAQKRHGQDHEREQTDRHSNARDDDGSPGGLHGSHEGLIALGAESTLLPPPRHDQEGVVDRDTKANQANEELHDDGDVSQARENTQHEERGWDRDERDHQRRQRQERCEHEDQHCKCAEAAEQHLDQQARSLTAAATITGQHRNAGQRNRGASDRGVRNDCLNRR